MLFTCPADLTHILSVLEHLVDLSLSLDERRVDERAGDDALVKEEAEDVGEFGAIEGGGEGGANEGLQGGKRKMRWSVRRMGKRRSGREEKRARKTTHFARRPRHDRPQHTPHSFLPMARDELSA